MRYTYKYKYRSYKIEKYKFIFIVIVQRIQFIGYRSLKYHTNLPCTLNRVHDF